MSTLSRLIDTVARDNAQLAADLRREVRALEERRAFGLNFERHTPETVELPGRAIRRGDKVRFLVERGSSDAVDSRLWRVDRVERSTQTAHLLAIDEPADRTTRAIEDLVVVAQFRDPIYPGLVSTGRIERGGDKPFHTVINAENFHALQTLLFTHEGKLDVIYIDPPYNTRDKDWKYNNDYVDKDDLYRHSKWLAFMERRLKLARRLLKPEDSALIVTIDEKEYLRLGLLLEQTFPEAQIQMITTMTNKKGSTRPGRFSRSEEYIYFVMLGAAKIAHGADNMMLAVDDADSTTTAAAAAPTVWNSLLRRGTDAMRDDRPNMFYPVYVNSDTRQIVGIGEPLDRSTDRAAVERNPRIPTDALVSWPLRREGVEGRWQVGRETLQRLVDAGRARAGEFNRESDQHSIVTIKDKQMRDIEAGRLRITGRDSGGALVVAASGERETENSNSARSIWVRDAHDASVYGSTLLGAMLPGRKFPFPKSLYAVEDTLRFVVRDKPDAIVLDFFAGSGTTAHAVMRLNRQDGGSRQSISVTNNEVAAAEATRMQRDGLRPGDADWESLGICEFITKPRIRAAISGNAPSGKPIRGAYKFVDERPIAEGLEQNVEFFTMTYETPRAVAHHRSFAAIAPLLWIRAGARGRRIDQATNDYAVADVYGVLFDMDHSHDFLAELANTEAVTMAFIVTDDDRAYQMVCGELPEHVEPVRLYESYLTNFTINTGKE